MTPHWRNVIDTVDMLPVLVREERLRRGLSQRAAAAEMGYAFADLCRFEKGTKAPTYTSVKSMLHWLARSADLPVQGERPICVRCGGWADDPNVMHHPTKGCYGMPPLLPVQGEPPK